MAIVRKCHIEERTNDITNNRQDSFWECALPLQAVRRPSGKSLHTSDNWEKWQLLLHLRSQVLPLRNTWQSQFRHEGMASRKELRYWVLGICSHYFTPWQLGQVRYDPRAPIRTKTRTALIEGIWGSNNEKIIWERQRGRGRRRVSVF